MFSETARKHKQRNFISKIRNTSNCHRIIRNAPFQTIKAIVFLKLVYIQDMKEVKCAAKNCLKAETRYVHLVLRSML